MRRTMCTWAFLFALAGCSSSESEPGASVDTNTNPTTGDDVATADAGTAEDTDLPHPCEMDPCVNGGTCTPDGPTFTCDCPDGYAGNLCEVNEDDCDPNPCDNGGTCIDEVAGFSCVCADGYSGDTCGTNDDDCEPNPCFNVGTCQDGVDSYTCDCPAGFEGAQCETNTDDCADNPCQNGASCVDQTNGYICVCPDGFTGDDKRYRRGRLRPEPVFQRGRLH